MILDAAMGGTVMVDIEQATRIIGALASTDYQAQHDRQTVQQKKGMLDLNTTNALLAKKKYLNATDGSTNQIDDKVASTITSCTVFPNSRSIHEL